jgi:antirestriction protein ArdC
MQQETGARRTDIYQAVTKTIVAQIEAGAGTYRMPWHHDGSPTTRPTNAVSNTFYRGINVVALWAAAASRGYPTGLWATYRQWQEIGAQVRKGEQGTQVVFWKKLDADDDDEETNPHIVARGFTVFNATQVDGYAPPMIPELGEAERIQKAERFWKRLGIAMLSGGTQAYYSPSSDYVQMPPFKLFRNAVAYYATLLHEGAHATGSRHRLNRDLLSRFGSDAYAMEEMIAEMASAIVCTTLALPPEPRPDHAHYIASWLKAHESPHFGCSDLGRVLK